MMRLLTLLACLLCPAVIGAQAPPAVAIEPKALFQLAAAWTNDTLPGTHACLFGHQEAQVIVLDSITVEPKAEPDSTICPRPAIGATGFYRGYVGQEEERQGVASMARVLAARPDWLIAGIVHGIVPAFVNGVRVPAPLMWGAVRPIPAKSQT